MSRRDKVISSGAPELGISAQRVRLAAVVLEGIAGTDWVVVGLEEGSGGEGEVAVAAELVTSIGAAEVVTLIGAAEEFGILQTAGWGSGLLNEGEPAELVGCEDGEVAGGDVVDS